MADGNSTIVGWSDGRWRQLACRRGAGRRCGPRGGNGGPRWWLDVVADGDTLGGGESGQCGASMLPHGGRCLVTEACAKKTEGGAPVGLDVVACQ
jgi:hypothetical protein